MIRVFFILTFIPILTLAAAKDAGCFDPMGKNINNVVSQSSLITANVMSQPTTTSAMTSGTSGCKTNGFVFNDKEAGVFMAQHTHELEAEAIVGQGTHISAFSELLGCETKQNKVIEALQSSASPISTKDFQENTVQRWLSSLSEQCHI